MPILVIAIVLLAACAGPESSAEPIDSPTESPSPAAPTATATAAPTEAPTATASPEPVGVMIAAGDIAACDEEGDSATAALIADLDGTVATLGDNVYPQGSDATYADCYGPTWGAFRDRTRPAIGNHDFDSDGGAAYSRYFGEVAGAPGEGWYSYDLGTWHVVVLNSMCAAVGCGTGSAQMDWLVADLAGSDATCTVAYWHHPRFSSGPYGGFPEVEPLWHALAAADAELVLVGHEHHYERFAPQTSSGEPDPEGIRQFIVGTGGKELRPTVGVVPNSEAIIDHAFGVLQLTLAPDAYEWSFFTADGAEADAGTGTCH